MWHTIAASRVTDGGVKGIPLLERGSGVCLSFLLLGEIRSGGAEGSVISEIGLAIVRRERTHTTRAKPGTRDDAKS